MENLLSGIVLGTIDMAVTQRDKNLYPVELKFYLGWEDTQKINNVNQ